MKVLGLDPGYGRLGYGVVEMRGSRLSALAFGVIETPAKMDFQERLLKVHRGVRDLLASHRPDEAAIETLFFSKNTKTALKVAEARGVLRLALKEAGVPELECSPQAVKMALAGTGSADKGQVTRMVTRLLGLPGPPKPDDAADALALALTAIRSRGMRSMAALALEKKGKNAK
ncbi:MAG: crossover junction endodeoxyribonuclease RuvC [candidate division FCPU426 bacterium]